MVQENFQNWPRSRRTSVAMMQPADVRNGDYVALLRRLDCTKIGRVLFERSMRSGRMIIGAIIAKQFLEMPLVEDNHMVEQLAP